MIIVMEPGASPEAVEAVEKRIRAAGLDVHVSRGVERTLVGAVGDERSLEPDMFESLPGVERAMHIVKPYKLVSREWHPGRTDVDVDGAVIGEGAVQVIAGPCSVETDEQMAAAADAVARGGARLMRGGAFKPRNDDCIVLVTQKALLPHRNGSAVLGAKAQHRQAVAAARQLFGNCLHICVLDAIGQ